MSAWWRRAKKFKAVTVPTYIENGSKNHILLAIETSGAFGPDALGLVHDIAKRMGGITQEVKARGSGLPASATFSHCPARQRSCSHGDHLNGSSFLVDSFVVVLLLFCLYFFVCHYHFVLVHIFGVVFIYLCFIISVVNCLLVMLNVGQHNYSNV